MHDMGSFFPLVVLRPTGKGKFTRKDRKFERVGSIKFCQGSTVGSKSFSESHVNFYVYSNGSPRIWQHLPIDCTFIRLPKNCLNLKLGNFVAQPSKLRQIYNIFTIQKTNLISQIPNTLHRVILHQ